MPQHLFYSSLTRISPLPYSSFEIERLDREHWATGDYAVFEVLDASGYKHVELTTGRQTELVEGDRFVGALGKRRATLESVGDWEAADSDGIMHLLTGAGLAGKVISHSRFLPKSVTIRYDGHVMMGREKATMRRFLGKFDNRPFRTPTVLIIGTSMSSGKTTAGRTIVRRLTKMGLRVMAAKVTGAGRYRDIQKAGDSGAEWIYDFVDAGLPSTVVPEDEYRDAIRGLLSRMAADPADVAVIEIGASPFEPYHGEAAMEILEPAVRCTVLAAFDPYAAKGLMDIGGIRPDLICGPTANTEAGVEMTKRFCNVPVLSLARPENHAALDQILRNRLKIED